MNRLRIGLVGCGAIGTELARSIETRFFKKASLEAMCEKNPDRAQELAGSLKYIPQLTTLEELVDRVDLVIEAASIDVVPQILELAVKKGICSPDSIWASLLLVVKTLGEAITSPRDSTSKAESSTSRIVPSARRAKVNPMVPAAFETGKFTESERSCGSAPNRRALLAI